MKLQLPKLNLHESVQKKLASGRYCLALMAGITFVFCAVSGRLDTADTVMILVVVFQAYFGRDRHDESGAGE